MAKTGAKEAGKAGKTGQGGKAGKAGGIVTVAALTVLALAGGAVTGKVIAGRLRAGPAGPAAAPMTAEAAKGAAPYGDDTVLRELPAIVANLAQPAEMRIRLQLAIVFPKKGVEQPDVLAGQVTDDVVAFVKTLTVAELQGASGLQALREDLADRARTRSDGKVREVVIENLVVQ